MLRESYCFYIDFLGFSRLLNSAKNLPEEQTLLDKFVGEVSSHIEETTKPKKYDMGLGGELLWGAKVFSDNVVLGYPSKSKEKEIELGFALYKAMGYQLNCVLTGYLVRGGMSHGNLCITDNIIFGKALLEAVGLENEACYPRIKVGDSIKEIARYHMGFYARPNSSPHIHTFLTDNEGVWFLNYLKWLAEDEFINRRSLGLHKDLIQRMLVTYSEDKEIKIKYLWVAEYHNWFCRNYADDNGDIESFVIHGITDHFGIRFLTEEELG